MSIRELKELKIKPWLVITIVILLVGTIYSLYVADDKSTIVILLVGIIYAWVAVDKHRTRTEENRIREKLYDAFVIARSRTNELVIVMSRMDINSTSELSPENFNNIAKIMGNQSEQIDRLKGLIQFYVEDQTKINRLNEYIDQLLRIPNKIDQNTNIEIYNIWENIVKTLKNVKFTLI